MKDFTDFIVVVWGICCITTICCLCFRDYDSLSKENVFDNNKLVSVTFQCHSNKLVYSVTVSITDLVSTIITWTSCYLFILIWLFINRLQTFRFYSISTRFLYCLSRIMVLMITRKQDVCLCRAWLAVDMPVYTFSVMSFSACSEYIMVRENSAVLCWTLTYIRIIIYFRFCRFIALNEGL